MTILFVPVCWCKAVSSLFLKCFACFIIFNSQSARLRDDEIEDLEQQLQKQALGQMAQPPPPPQQDQPLPRDSFHFQTGLYGEWFSIGTVVAFRYRLALA